MRSSLALCAVVVAVVVAEPAWAYPTPWAPTRAAAVSAPRGSTPNDLAYQLAIYYAVPTDVAENPAALNRIKDVVADITRWYQCATTGRTWEFAFPETVRVYHATQTRDYYKNNGDWWGSLLPEMTTAGLPVSTNGIVCAVWAHGAGWYKEAAQGCGGECGTALLGVELLPEFNNAAYSGGLCPNGEGIGAFPCTPEGAFANALGHTLGLIDPTGDPQTTAVATHSVMKTYWNYPTFAPHVDMPWGFLTLERQSLASNPFMKDSIDLVQTHDCDVVNLPMRGALPTAFFTYEETEEPGVVQFSNTSGGASAYYWTFGDGGRSDVDNPLHGYSQTGSFTVTLRATEPSAMIALYSAVVPITSTATQVSVVQSRAEHGRVRLVWQASGTPSVVVWRREEGQGWLAIGEPTSLGTGLLAYEDHDVTPGRRYTYRLAIESGTGVELLGEVSVAIPRDGLTVQGVNPSRGALLLRLSLPSDLPATLETYDVAGRRLSSRRLDGLGAGSHVVSAGDRLPAAVYLVRLIQGKQTAETRAVVIAP